MASEKISKVQQQQIFALLVTEQLCFALCILLNYSVIRVIASKCHRDKLKKLMLFKKNSIFSQFFNPKSYNLTGKVKLKFYNTSY